MRLVLSLLPLWNRGVRLIVRINQIDFAGAEHGSGWPQHGPAAGIIHHFPRSANAFELLILDIDENNQRIDPSARQAQTRQLIPDVVAALLDPPAEAVARLDGAMLTSELAAAMQYVVDARGYGRFAISSMRKLTPAPDLAAGSVRFVLLPQKLAALCNDSSISLVGSVRLRVLTVPPSLVNRVLELDDAEDPHWRDVLQETPLVVSTTTKLHSIQIITPSLDAEQVKMRLMERLTRQPDA